MLDIDLINLGQTLFNRGGAVAIFLVGLSIIALAVIVLKAIEFGRLRRVDFLDAVDALVTKGYLDRAIDSLAQQDHPVARVFYAALDLTKRSVSRGAHDAEIDRVIDEEVSLIERGLPLLAMIVAIAPLIGLLGTVVGMIDSFVDLEGAGYNVNVALLAGGIWKALLTTAMGLTIAVVCLFAHYIFDHQVRRIEGMMTKVLSQLRLMEPSGRA